MSLDSAPYRPYRDQAAGVASARPDANASALAAIRDHHARLAQQELALTEAVIGGARRGTAATARDRLHDWYRTELAPHIRAEERALYSEAQSLNATRLLAGGMLAQHRSLTALMDALAGATDAVAMAENAAAAHAVFALHVGEENDLLLPALDRAGVDLAAALAGMHEASLGPAPSTGPAAECGCGCDHEGHAGTTIQIGSGPPAEQPPGPGGPGDLDVRALPHGSRHEIIFTRLDALGPGESLVIVNDHDPKPLRYQTAAMWPDRFSWSYLQSGPHVWRLAITRAE